MTHGTHEEGIYWCGVHNREATAFFVNAKGKIDRCCDPKLGGILLSCSVKKVPMKIIKDDETETK
jgi:hypothetical protein